MAICYTWPIGSGANDKKTGIKCFLLIAHAPDSKDQVDGVNFK